MERERVGEDASSAEEQGWLSGTFGPDVFQSRMPGKSAYPKADCSPHLPHRLPPGCFLPLGPWRLARPLPPDGDVWTQLIPYMKTVWPGRDEGDLLSRGS